jgi:hypothetical protein
MSLVQQYFFSDDVLKRVMPYVGYPRFIFSCRCLPMHSAVMYIHTLSRTYTYTFLLICIIKNIGQKGTVAGKSKL